MVNFSSWGNYPIVEHSSIQSYIWRHDIPSFADSGTYLPYGLGRSYGDSCLNDNNILIHTVQLNKFISFDATTGILHCESGVSLEHILHEFAPRGWFLPVTPGTKYITVGGAVANDVHGKNHHRRGTFGAHVKALTLLRSDGKQYYCTPTENKELFSATIGGMGLTGLISDIAFQLLPIESTYIDNHSTKFSCVDDFFELCEDAEDEFEYTVAWIDCLATGKNLGRGHYYRGNHSKKKRKNIAKKPIGIIPFFAPEFVLNPLSIRAFNTAYYNKQFGTTIKNTVHYEPFFYPLDIVHQWNKLYGRRGFLQYQCVVPLADGSDAIKEMLARVAASGTGSFLAVLKKFGNISSPGLMSFPIEGYTLTLDFAMRGDSTLQLLQTLDDVVKKTGGRLYPAKDARMSAEIFRNGYPQWQEFSQYIDPKFSSTFWRRVTKESL